MCKIPFRGWIANAAARFSGPRGSVAQQAQQADCSRQTVYDHARKVEAAVKAEHGGRATRMSKRIREIAALRRENGATVGLAVSDHRASAGQATDVRRHSDGNGAQPHPSPRLVGVSLGGQGVSLSHDDSSLEL